MFEGIPGSGKTTLSRMACEYLNENGVAARHFAEGGAHPADLGWCACVPEDALDALLNQFPDRRAELLSAAEFFMGCAVIPYLAFSDDRALRDALEAYEVYDGRVPMAAFTKLHRGRWARFADDAAAYERVTVFECAYFQNHVNELLLFRDAGYEQIRAHMLALYRSVEKLEPLLIYLRQPDIAETIGRVAAERVSPEENWIDRVVGYIETCPYGRARGYSGYSGALKAFSDRRAVEEKLLPDLPIRSIIIENPSRDWDAVWADIRRALDANFIP